MLCGCFGTPRIPEPTFPPGIDDWSAGFDMLFLWSNAISLLMLAVCVAIIIWAPMPGLKTWAYIGATVAGILLAVSIFFSVVKPFIPWIVLGTLGIALLIGLWFIIVNFHLLRKVIHLDKNEYKAELTTHEQKIVAQCQTPPISK
jgi:glucan phosphoethanolaminetransferase (alkaline phosphatase superfamily)